MVYVKRKGVGAPFPAGVPNLTFDDVAGVAHFRGAELATYQIAIKSDAGVAHARRYTNRAIVGISMGGGGAANIGLSEHTKFDVIAAMVPERAWTQLLAAHVSAILRFGGSAPPRRGRLGWREKVGMECPIAAPGDDRAERAAGHLREHAVSEGRGVGLTLDRSLYMKGVRDFSGLTATLRCGTRTIPTCRRASRRTSSPSRWKSAAGHRRVGHLLKNFFDARFNPTGARDVISFCVTATTVGRARPRRVRSRGRRATSRPKLPRRRYQRQRKRDQGEPVVSSRARTRRTSVRRQGLQGRDGL